MKIKAIRLHGHNIYQRCVKELESSQFRINKGNCVFGQFHLVQKKQYSISIKNIQ